MVLFLLLLGSRDGLYRSFLLATKSRSFLLQLLIHTSVRHRHQIVIYPLGVFSSFCSSILQFLFAQLFLSALHPFTFFLPSNSFVVRCL